MKLVDLNVLIYATDDRSVHHRTARPWLQEALDSSETIGVPLLVSIGFVRLTTNPRIMRHPLGAAAAIGVISGLLERPNVAVPSPTRRHYSVLAELLEATGTAANLVTDAHLATLAIEHGAQLCSYDTDFQRFPQVDWLDPSAP